MNQSFRREVSGLYKMVALLERKFRALNRENAKEQVAFPADLSKPQTMLYGLQVSLKETTAHAK